MMTGHTGKKNNAQKYDTDTHKYAHKPVFVQL